MVFTLGLRHTFVFWQRAMAFGTIYRSSEIARFVQGGVVKTFRCAIQTFDDGRLSHI